MTRKIVIKNRQKHDERLELTLEELKVKFQNELRLVKFLLGSFILLLCLTSLIFYSSRF